MDINDYYHWHNNSSIDKAGGIVIYIGKNIIYQFHLEPVNVLEALSLLTNVTNNSSLKDFWFYRFHQYDKDFL